MTQKKVTLAYVHPGSVRHEFMDSVLKMYYSGLYELSVCRSETTTNVQKGRNDCVRWFLENGSDYLFFADTDMQWTPDVPERLIERGEPIVSALYLGRDGNGKSFPVGQAWLEESDNEVMRHLTMDDFDGLTEVAGVGMGCCVISREVLTMLGTHGHPDLWPFAGGQTENGGTTLSVSEDIGFCLRARSLGYRSYIDADVSVGHVKTFVIAPPERDSHEARLTTVQAGGAA